DSLNRTLSLLGQTNDGSFGNFNDLETGNFSTTGNWHSISGGAITGWTITNGGDSITHTAGSSATSNWLYNDGVPLTSGHTYQVSFDVDGTCGGSSEYILIDMGGRQHYIHGDDCSSTHTVTETVNFGGSE